MKKTRSLLAFTASSLLISVVANADDNVAPGAICRPYYLANPPEYEWYGKYMASTEGLPTGSSHLATCPIVRDLTTTMMTDVWVRVENNAEVAENRINTRCPKWNFQSSSRPTRRPEGLDSEAAPIAAGTEGWKQQVPTEVVTDSITTW